MIIRISVIDIHTAKNGVSEKLSNHGIKIEKKEVIFGLKMCGDCFMYFDDDAGEILYVIQLYYVGLSTSKINFYKKGRLDVSETVPTKLDCAESHMFKVLWSQNNTGIWLKENRMWKNLYYWQDQYPDNYTISDIRLGTYQEIGLWKVYKLGKPVYHIDEVDV